MHYPLSQDYLLARANELDSSSDAKHKLAPPTTRNYDSVYSRWEIFQQRIGDTTIVPERKWLMLFFETLAREGKGLLSEYPSLQTLNEYLIRFRTDYNRRHGNFITNEIFAAAYKV